MLLFCAMLLKVDDWFLKPAALPVVCGNKRTYEWQIVHSSMYRCIVNDICVKVNIPRFHRASLLPEPVLVCKPVNLLAFVKLYTCADCVVSDDCLVVLLFH